MERDSIQLRMWIGELQGMKRQARKKLLASPPAWFIYSLLTILFWGLWGIQSKMIMGSISPLTNQVLFTPGLLFVALLIGLRRGKQDIRSNRKPGLGRAFAVTTGIFGAVGNIAFFEALNQGPPASIVVPLTSLYPMVTVILALIFLRERLNRFQAIGIAFALIAVVILAG